MSHSEIARKLGITRECVSEIVNQMVPADEGSCMAGTAGYRWIVWALSVSDPHGVAGTEVAERTGPAVGNVAAARGCVYEYCVDDDQHPDGTKYYSWVVGVSRSESENLVGGMPVVMAEILGVLLSLLPTLDRDELWAVGPDLYATRQRNLVYHGYNNEGADMPRELTAAERADILARNRQTWEDHFRRIGLTPPGAENSLARWAEAMRRRERAETQLRAIRSEELPHVTSETSLANPYLLSAADAGIFDDEVQRDR